MADLEIPRPPLAQIDGPHLRELLLEIGMSTRSFAHYMALGEREVRRMCAGEAEVPQAAARWVLAGVEVLRGKLGPRNGIWARHGETR